MPLIQCPDCKANVSDKAQNCIKCGYPIQELAFEPQVDLDLEQITAEIKNDASFKIGRQVVNWGGNAFLKNMTADIEARDLGPLEPGQFAFYLHKKGIRIRNKTIGNGHYDIHFRQIIDISEKSAEEMVHEKKSVIGRGIAGGVLLGPAGAIVGALSAMNTSSLKKLTIIKLSFCDPETFLRKDTYFRVPRGTSTLFVAKVQKEISQARPSYRNKFLEHTIPYIERLSPNHAEKLRDELKNNQASDETPDTRKKNDV